MIIMGGFSRLGAGAPGLGPEMAKDRDPSERHRRRRGKNLALLAVLVGLVVLFYLVTLVKFGGG